MTLYNLSFSSLFLVPPGYYWVCSEHYERVCVCGVMRCVETASYVIVIGEM